MADVIRVIVLTLSPNERAVLYNALQDAVDHQNIHDKPGEAEETQELLNRVEKLPHG